MSELQVSSCLGHLGQPCWQAGCSSGHSDVFGSHGHKASLTCALLRDPLLMTHHGLNKPGASLHCLVPLATNHRKGSLHPLFSLHMEGKFHNLATGLSLPGSSEIQKKQRTK